MGRSGRRGGLSHGPPEAPRSPASASVPRRAILRPNPSSYPTSWGPTTPAGTNHDGHYREPRPRRRQLRRRQRATTRPRPYHHRHPGPHAVPATVPLLSPGPPEAPRSPAGRFCDQIRPRTQPPGDQPTPKGPPVAEGAEGSRTTTSGERRGAGRQGQASGARRHPWGRAQHSPTLNSEHGAGFGSPRKQGEQLGRLQRHANLLQGVTHRLELDGNYRTTSKKT